MYSLDDLLRKVREIEDLIREKTKPDGSCDFDTEQAMMSLELARRMIGREGKTE